MPRSGGAFTLALHRPGKALSGRPKLIPPIASAIDSTHLFSLLAMREAIPERKGQLSSSSFQNFVPWIVAWSARPCLVS